ncbi:DegT/DnrJ/EryC1/StrS family aminotransferase [Alpinimonas psychrophila]|uniref:dTDP-4-amino-4,6-dideoxygalactose transaminase n=1 Tax=Alpinimonas psychrophila TaxID=748908 RepID=A0A7W3PPB0_9MICO|nr:DegT/DnrJ/EryC1/StrS family aminotransferase [Alpinimonas psychrophila]MBA8829275.1 dTDP-4-amino-4,6-dideoxygalactose transaminase [Alpinimonas psychrophila]
MHNNSKIPFNDLGRGTRAIRGQLDGVIARVVSNGWFVMGPEHDALERELASYVGVKHAINVGNGTDALELALAAAGVTRGGTVVTVANAGAYTTIAARLLGAEPVYCDVDATTLLMSAATLNETLRLLPEKPHAIVVTHLYGALAPIEELVIVAREHGIRIIEDCAQSMGASESGRRGGSFADLSTTSFYPTKNLGALGDGGAVFTNDDDLADTVRRMRQYGWASKYSIEYAHGRNSRLDEIQAAILRIKLPFLDQQNEKRRVIHSAYEKTAHDGMRILNRSSESFNGHLAVIVIENRDKVRADFAAAGITTDVHYPIPDHQQKYADFMPRAMPLEVTEWAVRNILSVPLFPELSTEEVSRISRALKLV